MSAQAALDGHWRKHLARFEPTLAGMHQHELAAEAWGNTSPSDLPTIRHTERNPHVAREATAAIDRHSKPETTKR